MATNSDDQTKNNENHTSDVKISTPISNGVESDEITKESEVDRTKNTTSGRQSTRDDKESKTKVENNVIMKDASLLRESKDKIIDNNLTNIDKRSTTDTERTPQSNNGERSMENEKNILDNKLTKHTEIITKDIEDTPTDHNAELTTESENKIIGSFTKGNERSMIANDVNTTENDVKVSIESQNKTVGGLMNEDKRNVTNDEVIPTDDDVGLRTESQSKTVGNQLKNDARTTADTESTPKDNELKVESTKDNNTDEQKNRLEDEVIQEYTLLAHHLKDEHEKEMEDLRISLEENYNQQVLKISEELRDHYQHDMDEKIAKLEEDWELEFSKQKIEFDKQISAVQKDQWNQCQDAIERVTLDAEDQLKNMKHTYERETAEYRRLIQDLTTKQTLSEVKEKENNEEKCQKENEQLAKIKTLEKQLSDEKVELESQVDGANNKINDLKKIHEKEMEQLRSELERKYNVILNETKIEIKKKYQDELDEKVGRVECHLRTQYEKDLEKTREELHESSTTLKSKYEKQLNEVLSELEELHEKNQEHELKQAELKKEYQNAKEKIKQLEDKVARKNKHKKEYVNNNEDLDEGEVKEEEKLSAIYSEMTLLQVKLKEREKEKDELKCKHSEEVEQVKSINEEKVKKINTELQLRNKIISENETTVAELCTTITEQEGSIKKLQSTLDTHQATITDLTTTITELKTSKAENQRPIPDQKLTSQLETTIKDQKTTITDLRSKITRQDKTIVNQQATIAEQTATITEQTATISELEKTSSARELEIANLILHSPLPSETIEQEFEFSDKPEERVKQLEEEIRKYKKKVKDLEEEAEDKFEKTFCEKYEESREEILAKANALVEKIENDCEEKVESLTKKIELYDDKLKEQTTTRKRLEEKMEKVEKELEKERHRSMELCKLHKQLDMNEHLSNQEKSKDLEKSSETEVKVDSDKINEIKNEYEALLKKLQVEISKKDCEISKVTEEKVMQDSSVEMLRQRIKEEKEKYDELVERTKDQKQSYESEIELMQKEIETLLEEGKEKEKKCEMVNVHLKENSILQTKINHLEKRLIEISLKHEKELQDIQTAMADSSKKYEHELKRLQEIIKIKELSVENLQDVQNSLDASTKDMNEDLENIKTKFKEKEQKLLNEIQEETAKLENEKNVILENSFQEKEELLMRVKHLEKLCKDSNIWLNGQPETTDSEREMSFERTEFGKDEAWISGYDSDPKDTGGYCWKDEDKQKYIGIDRSNDWPVNYKPFPWTSIDTQVNLEYEISGDEEEQFDIKTKEDKEKDEINEIDRELEIDLLIEREERERLREELATMKKCVDIFHDECKNLKNTLDNTLNMVEIIKEERNNLIKQNDQNMEETSEIIQDLVKYEEIIRKLEVGNEKLEREKLLLLECIKKTNSHATEVPEKECVKDHNSLPSNLQTGQFEQEPERKVIRENEMRAARKNKLGNRGLRENVLEFDEYSGNEKELRKLPRWDPSKNWRHQSYTYTPLKSSKKSQNSSSFTTSTRINSQVKLRVIPNLSGLSPIVSQLERRQHERLLKWQEVDDPRQYVLLNEDETTFLTNADPYGGQKSQEATTLRQTPNIRQYPSIDRKASTKETPNTRLHPRTQITSRRSPSVQQTSNINRASHDRSASFPNRKEHTSQKKPRVHFRSRSADNPRTPRETSSFGNSFENISQDTPLVINFEDFIFRHRVKSSENIANLRDSSPAELWFS